MRFCLSFILLTILNLFTISAQMGPRVPADMPFYQKEMNSISKADVYSKTEWNYVISEGKVTTDNYKEKIIKYDKLGRIVEIMKINQKGENSSVIIFRYDGRNLPLQETEFLPTGEMIGKTKYTYDPKGRLTDITWLNSFEFIINRKVYDLDASASRITEWQYYSPDSVTSKTEYFYSNPENGVLLRQNNYNGESRLINSIIFIRDSTQIVLKEEIRDASQKLACYSEYQYNKNGQLQQVITIFPDKKKVPQFIYNYDEDGLLSGKIEYNQKGEMIEYKKYIYE
jgi:hypothetical protein